jgi:hypothetical protein
VVAIVAAALAGLVAQELGAPKVVCIVIAVAAFFGAAAALAVWGFKGIAGFWRNLSPRFAQPPR